MHCNVQFTQYRVTTLKKLQSISNFSCCYYYSAISSIYDLHKGERKRCSESCVCLLAAVHYKLTMYLCAKLEPPV